MSKIIEAVKEAQAIASGRQPAAVLHHNGHAYVPQSETFRLRDLLRDEITPVLAKMLEETKTISDGRHKVLMEKSEELRSEWIRAERAEAEVARLTALLAEAREALLSRANEIAASHEPASAVNELRRAVAMLGEAE